MGTVDSLDREQSHRPSRRWTNEGDYSSVAWKLGSLLELPPQAHIALVGNVPERWCYAFREEGFNVSECARLQQLLDLPGKAALVIWFPGREDAEVDARRVAAALDSSGRLLLLRKNRLAPFWGRRSAALFLDRSSRVWSREKQALVKSGFRVNSIWLPWPSYEAPEEFINLDDLEEFRTSAGFNRRLWARLRSWGHDGYLMLGVLPKLEDWRVGASFISVINESRQGEGPLRLSRFDLRDRGALVLMLRDAGGKSIVTRVAKRGAVANHVSANEEKIIRLRKAAAFLPSVLSLLPMPHARLQHDDCIVWVEKRIAGVVSWRLPRRKRNRLDEGWMSFLTDLSKVGAREDTLDYQRALSALSAFGEAATCVHLADEIAVAYDRLKLALASRIAGRRCAFAWSHGDFGYGNLMADRESGALTGVIDWETASEREFACTDWMNMLIVRESENAGSDVAKGVGSVLEKLSSSSHRGEDQAVARLKRIVEELYEDPIWLFLLLGIALLRVIQRQARYPNLFEVHEQEYLHALRRLHGALTQHVALEIS